MQPTVLIAKHLCQAPRRLDVQLINRALVAERVRRFIKTVRDAGDQFAVNVLAQLLQPLAKDLSFFEQHIPFAEPELDVRREGFGEHVLGSQAGGSVWRGVLA